MTHRTSRAYLSTRYGGTGIKGKGFQVKKKSGGLAEEVTNFEQRRNAKSSAPGSEHRSPQCSAACLIVKKSDGVCFEHVLMPGLVGRTSPLKDFDGNSSKAFLRVDCCGMVSAEQIRAFARALSVLGMKATFFLLPPGSYASDFFAEDGVGDAENYFGKWAGSELKANDSLKSLIDSLLAAGHEIGLHNDVVTASLTRKICLPDILNLCLSALRSCGANVTGSAAHGSTLARRLIFNNREIFSGVSRPGRDAHRLINHSGFSIQMGVINPEDFGLRYEAYELPRPHRLSESGGVWGGRVNNKRIPREEMRKVFDFKLFSEVAADLNSPRTEGPKHILVHPRHWEVK